MSPSVVFGYGLLAVVVLYAGFFGDWPERAGAALFATAAVATLVLRSPTTIRYDHVETGVLVVDILLVAGLTYLVFRSNRGWLIWATAFQSISTLAHLSKAVDPNFWRFAYGLMVNLSGFPTVIALAIGVTQAVRRRRQDVRESLSGH